MTSACSPDLTVDLTVAGNLDSVAVKFKVSAVKFKVAAVNDQIYQTSDQF